jgi:photosystem II stability/assembly factor-like uncharacterized protein
MKSWRAATYSCASCAALVASLCGPLPAAASKASAEPRTTTTVPSLSLDIVSQGTARIPPPSVVGPAGPASGQIGLVFTSGQTGYLAAVPEPQTSGYAAGATSVLQRTTDGGASWATVWRARDIVLHWVGTIAGAAVAAGLGARGPLLVESADGGTSWHEVPVAISLPSASAQAAQAGGAAWYWATSTLYFANQQVGFAYPNAMYGEDAAWPRLLLRTTDGGRRWAPVPFPGGTPSGGLVFVDPTHGFATGLIALSATGSELRGCTSRIWQTSDAGASWRVVPGTCVGYLLTSLSFPTPGRGYAGGGNYAKYGLAPQLALLSTADGGRRWSEVFATPKSAAVPVGGYGGPFRELHFYDATHGVALAGGCTMGANGPCQGQVWWTSDGGRSWSVQDEQGSQLAVAGRSGAWLAGGTPGSNVLWRSGDGGRSWAPVASPGKARLSGLLAAGERLWVSTEAGQFMSEDGGRAWHGVPAATLAAEGGPFGGPVAELGASGLVVVQTGTSTVWVSDDGGRTGRSFAIAGLGQAGTSVVSFADDKDGLALGEGSCAAFKPVTPPISFPLRPTTVVATHDGGATWQAVATVDVAGYGGLAYSQALAVVAATCAKGIATSADGGGTWTYWNVPADLSGCQQPSISGGTVAFSCPSYIAGAVTLRLLVSQDGGQHWSVYQLSGPWAQDVQGIVASGPRVLWAFGQATGEVWRSRDGGATWGPVDLALPVRP